MGRPDAPLPFRVEKVALRAGSLRQGASPLRFAQLADLHVRKAGREFGLAVGVINQWQPDLVLISGDLISYSERSWDLLARFLPKLKPRLGTYACPGNWEVKTPVRLAELRERLLAWNVVLLVNESATVDTHAGMVRIAGVDDVALGWPDFAAALREGADADYTVMLAHVPLAARMVDPDMGVNLMLSGHTHGGQMLIPLVWRRFLPSGHNGMVAGLYETEWGHVYVNRGFGAAPLLPFRFRCPAEVTFIEITPG